jgi:hypothetical protein
MTENQVVKTGGHAIGVVDGIGKPRGPYEINVVPNCRVPDGTEIIFVAPISVAPRACPGKPRTIRMLAENEKNTP